MQKQAGSCDKSAQLGSKKGVGISWPDAPASQQVIKRHESVQLVEELLSRDNLLDQLSHYSSNVSFGNLQQTPEEERKELLNESPRSQASAWDRYDYPPAMYDDQ